MSTAYDTYWFRAAIAANGQLSATIIFEPSASIRVGRAAANDFVVPDLEFESLLLLSSGTDLHLLPESKVRMAGPGVRLKVEDHESSGGIVRVVAERVNFVVREGRLHLFLHYQPTKEDLDRIVVLDPSEFEGG